MAHDVFVSYSSKDKTIADAVCAVLENNGVRCWIAPRDILPGMSYGEAIIDAIHSARVMVLVFSSHANVSGHIPKEVERAVSSGVTIVPLRIEDVTPGKSLEYFIGSVHWLDAMTPPLEEHLEKLARTLQMILRGKADQAKPESEMRTIPRPAVEAEVPVQPVRQSMAKPVWIYVGAGAVLVLIVAMVSLRTRRTEDSSQSLRVQQQPAQVEPAPPAPSTPQQKPVPGGAGLSLEGCWKWFNGTMMTAQDNGAMDAGAFQGIWRVADPIRRVVTITWPKAVDKIIVTPDGSRMEGANQYGFATSGTRLSGASPDTLAGVWQWFNGVSVLMSSDGGVQAGALKAQWRSVDPRQRTFTITWPEPVDTLTMSSDGQSVNGANQYGFGISGTRAPCSR